MNDAAIYGGDLYRMQKEAAERARKTASRAACSDEPTGCAPAPSPKPQEMQPQAKKGIFASPDAVIIGAIVLILLNDGCNDTLLLLALAVLLIM